MSAIKLQQVRNVPKCKKVDGIDTSAYTPDYILKTALDIGELILRCGGEPHRIEDTIERVCSAYGAEHTEVFALPSLVISSVYMPDGKYSSQVRRIYQTSNDMYMLENVNKLSRDVCAGKVKLDDVEKSIDEIMAKKPFPRWLTYIGAVLGAGGFAVFFGGTLIDGLVAALAGLVINALNVHKAKFLNQMVHTVITSFIGAFFALLIVRLGLGDNSDKIMIGAIMLLIPGLAFGNAVRDLLFGDTVSGLIQIVQAILLAVMVAFGFAVALMIFGGVIV